MTNLDYLFGLEKLGIKLGLDNIRNLLECAGNPHETYPMLHVGGTNGKGSAVAVAGSIARAAGYRVGRFTSPHLIRINERFLIDAEPITDKALDRHIGYFRKIAGDLPHPPTFFEMTTAVAFRWFQEEHVDLAVIEVGLGGRLDSTNVIHPVASAITNIQLEHVIHLGPTLEHIAREKAGIIKPGVPVVLGDLEPGPRKVIEDTAARVEAPVYALGADFTYRLDRARPPALSYQGTRFGIPSSPLALAGRYQAHNTAVGIALAEQIRGHFPKIDVRAVQTGLREVRWPCRLEKVLDDPPVYVDVAHNPAGAQELAREFDRAVILIAIASDKDAPGMVKALAPIAQEFIYSQFTGPRALPADALAVAAAVHGRAIPCLAAAVETGVHLASDDVPLLITGSIFTVGEARQELIEKYGAPPLQF